MLESYIRLTEDRWLGTVNFYKDALPRENKLRDWATGWQQHILTIYEVLFHKIYDPRRNLEESSAILSESIQIGARTHVSQQCSVFV